MLARFFAACALIATPVLAPVAQAHDWYPLSCCGGQDCEPVSNRSIQFTSRGWLVKNTGEVIPFSVAKASPDGQFHRCRMKVSQPDSSTRCLFVPFTGY
ncbi:hypothetical protein [Propylenella binzhouense]|uniref:Secreted protein n=1 Tax=Propylenella binzhouense TaxID=2555902 RepID=A0A964T8E5_9HYPH|nr:hypothetical protein [Propylenella binzhouense]MYZ50364.1 hypothetical protein [Propylenella binzhouense]